jgi:hypothetical protein
MPNEGCGCSSRVELRVDTNKLPLVSNEDICIFEQCILIVGIKALGNKTKVKSASLYS